MDVLRRYENLRTFENSRGDIVSARYKRLDKSISSELHELNKPMTLDQLSLQYYGTPLMYWLIADYNDFIDPTITLPAGTKLNIPIIQ